DAALITWRSMRGEQAPPFEYARNAWLAGETIHTHVLASILSSLWIVAAAPAPRCTEIAEQFCRDLFSPTHRGNLDLPVGREVLRIRRQETRKRSLATIPNGPQEPPNRFGHPGDSAARFVAPGLRLGRAGTPGPSRDLLSVRGRSDSPIQAP